ncbi:MAG: hypothetical protein HC895_09865 [Leptolyngbyaceae cyanobacterium SM1_3_5]|nr:hypothetical protein [Leptolyngbyaceae cyanobacterium SM1_3_5]
MKTSNLKKWRKVAEFAVVGFATWLNPEAALLLFLLKLSFQILWTLQDGNCDRNEENQ